MNFEKQSGIFQFAEDPSSKNVEGIGKNYHEVLLLMKILQTKPQVENVNNYYYDLYYTVIKNRDEKEIVNSKNEIIENDCFNFNEFITPNHFLGTKNDNVMLR